MPLTLGTDLSTLQALSGLQSASSEKSTAFQRLSSGARIEHASDDAAGVALATKLRGDSLVYSNALRNVNEGLNLAAYKEDAIESLATIAERLQDLSTQAANTATSDTVRAQLNTEASALVKSYNSIVQSTRYNGKNILSNSLEIKIQTGNDTANFIPIASASNISIITEGSAVTTVAGGSVVAPVTYASTAGVSPDSAAVGDFDGDGDIDVVLSGAASGGKFNVFLNTGTGTFATVVTYSLGAGTWPTGIHNVESMDFNGDGKQDIIGFANDNTGVGKIIVALANSNGTFNVGVSYTVRNAAASNLSAIAGGDFDGDGNTDIVVGSATAGEGYFVLRGNSNGTFNAPVTYTIAGALSNSAGTLVRDVNNDGYDDILINDSTNNKLNVALGNGNGTFRAPTSYAGVDTVYLAAGDLNGDGNLDVVAGDFSSTVFTVFLGNSNGTFKAAVSYDIGVTNVGAPKIADFNGDGNADVVLGNVSNNFYIALGNGDGTFIAKRTYATGGGFAGTNVADFDGDGDVDVMFANNSGVAALNIILGNGDNLNVTSYTGFTLATAGAASYSSGLVTTAQNTLEKERGLIHGAHQRLEVAFSQLESLVSISDVAANRIFDVDTAAELTTLVSAEIKQEGSTAVLAHGGVSYDSVVQLLK